MHDSKEPNEKKLVFRGIFTVFWNWKIRGMENRGEGGGGDNGRREKRCVFEDI